MLQEDNDKLDITISLIHEVIRRLEQINPVEEVVFLTIVETASMFKVSERTIRRWHTDGFIKGFYIGGSMHFSKSELVKTAKVNKLNKK
jgi:DeoR/GlpR family transcriptional regulator of sugar metabolism